MATPTGVRADRARRFHARERRRLKQNQSAYIIAGHVATPFDFGAVAAGGSSANVLTLPADIVIALELDDDTVAGDTGVLDVTDSITYVSAVAALTGGRVSIRHLFRKPHQIRITRAIGAPAGAVIVYFRGRSQLIQVGAATFT